MDNSECRQLGNDVGWRSGRAGGLEKVLLGGGTCGMLELKCHGVTNHGWGVERGK